MQKYNLEGNGVQLVLEGNVLGVFSEAPLKTVSSAFHNGGIKETRVILNVEVPKDYGDESLHMDPDALMLESGRQVGVTGDFVSMVTAACVKNFALASKREGNLGVSVVATAADDAGNTCDHAESAGEEIDGQVHERGTINVIVVIDGNPTDSCLVSSIITATEAKTAAMLELDIRSRYSGAAATGTITDAIVVAKTGQGEPLLFGGPASTLGQLVASCTRQAVREAITKGQECSPRRSLLGRLAARHLPMEKLTQELSKAKSLHADKQKLTLTLSELLQKPQPAAAVLSAVKLDEEVQSGLIPPEIGDVAELSRKFGVLVSRGCGNCGSGLSVVGEEELALVDLPIFVKHVLIALLVDALCDAEN
ncbi:MAG: adenosylcobinamide amidohydrolase [Candidatus Bathyarchaeota archaeon]|nr:adenosylcobinamide amidohydrolase [Candidatus Bathyarchaeota archaeon]